MLTPSHLRARSVLGLVSLLLAVAACTSPTPAPTGQAPAAPSTAAGAEPGRTLVVAVRVEPVSLAPAVFREPGVTFQATPRFFNAGMGLLDDRGFAIPYLAEELPKLNSDAWQVFPDGRMQTTHRLKAGLTWHDGTPLSAQDFVFAWKVYTTPELGAANAQPHGSMEEVSAPDDRTVVIRWKQPYPEAATLSIRDRDFVPLPRHILEAAYTQDHSDAFLAHAFWSREYVGLGPYRVDRWDPGSSIDAVAFPGHALGAPKVQKIRLVFISDPSTAMANLLSDSVHVALEGSLRFQQGSTLRQNWETSHAGVSLMRPWLWRTIQIQLRQELANPQSLRDVRVRNALFHGIDRQELNDGVLEGAGAVTDSLISPLVDYYPTIADATVKHPYDPRRSEQLMTEAGYTKGADGFFTMGGERFNTEMRVLAGAQNEQELSIIGAGLRKVGFDVRESVLPAAAVQDAEVQSTFTGLFGTGHQSGEQVMSVYSSAGISRPENRWTGTNRGGWSTPESDRLSTQLLSTLDRDERIQLVAQMARILSEEVPFIPMYFSVDVVAHTAALKGPQIVAPDTATNWNVHQWEFR
jgi:peptide/nickel transport system substrate-binding protein